MLNLFTTTKSWMVASLLTVTTVFAQQGKQDNMKCRPQKSFDQGHEIMQNQMMPAYNAPARIDVRGSWDIYVTGSFIYWQARQDNMEIGVIADFSSPFVLGANLSITPVVPAHVKVVNSRFNYKPGFKVGLGANLDWDNWDVYSEYTWFHGTTSSRVRPLVAAGASPVQGQLNFLFPKETITNSSATFAAAVVQYFNSAKQSWNYKLDFVDISLARSSYSGTRLSVRPFFGARGAWIRQTLENTFLANTPTAAASLSDLFINQKYTSWGVGPRVGFESNWMLGYGVRLLGKGSADILYTRYNMRTRLFFDNITTTPPSPISFVKPSAQHTDALRAHADLELGFGWGSYFDNNNWHIDLAASYTYQVFWDQRMFLNFNSDHLAFGSFLTPTGNLYVHGMNLTARLDF